MINHLNKFNNKALFLDRDGIINEDVSYPHKPEHIKFCTDIFDLCKKANDLGYLIIVVTNQSGIARGLFTTNDVEKLHEWMRNEFLKRNINISAFYYCPYHVNGTIKEYSRESNCRKPNSGMIIQAVKDFSINLKESLMVGDKKSDRINLKELKCVVIKSKYTLSDNSFDVDSIKDIEQFLK